MNALGDRCKQYERNSSHYFMRGVPIVLRVDGRSFHSWTKKAGCIKPFDDHLITSMFEAAKSVSKEMSNFVALYAQSDEVTFYLNDNEIPNSEYWFGGKQSKLESVVASLMTAYFNNEYGRDHIPATFDCRAFQVPKGDVANVFLWRVKDWLRNSLNMYVSSFFPHGELQGKAMSERHEMLYSIGRNWATDLTDQQKNGSWFIDGRENFTIPDNYFDIDFEIHTKSLNRLLLSDFKTND